MIQVAYRELPGNFVVSATRLSPVRFVRLPPREPFNKLQVIATYPLRGEDLVVSFQAVPLTCFERAIKSSAEHAYLKALAAT